MFAFINKYGREIFSEYSPGSDDQGLYPRGNFNYVPDGTIELLTGRKIKPNSTVVCIDETIPLNRKRRIQALWVASDRNGKQYGYQKKPVRDEENGTWNGGCAEDVSLIELPDLKWENQPKRVLIVTYL